MYPQVKSLEVKFALSRALFSKPRRRFDELRQTQQLHAGNIQGIRKDGPDTSRRELGLPLPDTKEEEVPSSAGE